MTAAPPGAVVRIFIDKVARVAPDDIIETPTGRRYRVISVREQLSGKHVGRQHMVLTVLAATDLVPLDRVHTISWYKRGKKR